MTTKNKRIIEAMQVVTPANHSRKTENTKSPKTVVIASTKEEINPLAAIAGSYAEDPNWAAYLQALEELRREGNADRGAAE